MPAKLQKFAARSQTEVALHNYLVEAYSMNHTIRPESLKPHGLVSKYAVEAAAK